MAGGQSWRTNIFWSLVSFSTFNLHVILPIIHIFLTTLMVFITYTTILTYKYPSILPYFLTPYHFLPLLTLSLYFSSFSFFFNSLFSLFSLGAKVIKLLRGKIMSSQLGEVINPWDMFKSAFFYPKNFFTVGKKILLGVYKIPNLNLAQGLMMYFPQEGCSLFYPKMIGYFLPQEGEKK